MRATCRKVQSLIERGASVHATDYYSRTALHCATEGGHANVAYLLVHKGARVDALDKVGRTPVMLALDRGHKAVVEYLVSEGAAIDLQVAAFLGDVDKVAELIDNAPADVNEREGDAAMHHAVLQGQREVVRLLMTAGISLEEDGRGYGSPLRDAIRANRLEMVEFLLTTEPIRTRGGKTCGRP